MEQRFATQLSRNVWFRPGLKIGVAVSGGADSVALLRMLTEARAKLGIVVHAIHFNHKLRGRASDRDETFVAALAEMLSVAFRAGRTDVAGKAKQEKINLEDAARRARYEFFRQLTGEGVVDLVATAHTMDDQAETVLAHVLRGTGNRGTCGNSSGCGARGTPTAAVSARRFAQVLARKEAVVARRRDKPG
jgi:tRNA(Ile)-lysidine synthase